MKRELYGIIVKYNKYYISKLFLNITGNLVDITGNLVNFKKLVLSNFKKLVLSNFLKSSEKAKYNIIIVLGFTPYICNYSIKVTYTIRSALIPNHDTKYNLNLITI